MTFTMVKKRLLINALDEQCMYFFIKLNMQFLKYIQYMCIIGVFIGRYIPPHRRNKDYIEEEGRKDGPPPPPQRGYDQRDVRSSSYSDHRRGSRGHDDRRGGGYDHRGRDSYDRYRGDAYDRRGEDAYERRGSFDQRSNRGGDYYDSYDRRGSYRDDRDSYDRSRGDRQYSNNRDTPPAQSKPRGGEGRDGGYDETDSAAPTRSSDDKKDDKFHGSSGGGDQYDSQRYNSDTGGRWAQLDYDRRYSGPRYDDRRSSGRYYERRGSLPVRGFQDRDSTWGQYSSGYGHGPPSQWDKEEWKRPLPSNPRLERCNYCTCVL